MKQYSRFSLFSAIIISLPLFISSCLKDNSEEQRKLEMRILEGYLDKYDIEVEPLASGLYYIEEVAGTGDSPEEDDFLKVNYTITTVTDERVRYTTDSLIAKTEDFYSKWRLYGPELLVKGINIAGLEEGLSLMKEGGFSTLIIPSNLAWGAGGFNSPVDPYTSIVMNLELIEVISDIKAYESGLISDYISANSFQSQVNSDSIYYEDVLIGTGDTVTNGTPITINLKAYLLDGRLIASINTYRFQFGSTLNALITTGASKGIKRMKEGGKARWIVPSSMAFGTFTKYTYDELTKIPIPPSSPILYEVEVVSAK
jgi:FKBP-type peptidyl-prolyl cis-trans isomerase